MFPSYWLRSYLLVSLAVQEIKWWAHLMICCDILLNDPKCLYLMQIILQHQYDINLHRCSDTMSSHLGKTISQLVAPLSVSHQSLKITSQEVGYWIYWHGCDARWAPKQSSGWNSGCIQHGHPQGHHRAIMCRELTIKAGPKDGISKKIRQSLYKTSASHRFRCHTFSLSLPPLVASNQQNCGGVITLDLSHAIPFWNWESKGFYQGPNTATLKTRKLILEI